MAVIKCKMCGGDLNIGEGSSVVECEYCGSRQTIPTADNEKKMTLFARAGRLLRGCEFDKASGVFESIVADFPEEAEAYWGLVLCKYGIEYVDDPATGKKVPTCHRSSFDSVLDDPNFEQACENGDVIARRVYREEARQIEELRKGIIEVSGKEAPYDIFISYKETDDQGNRTLDSVIAQDLYNELTEKGYRVFFSRISLEDKLGVEYEPYIFAALNSARLMLVVGTDYEHFDAVWVKNEWSRFLKLISSGQKKVLIPVFKNMDPYDMPKEFAKLSAQDMGKVGAMQDLLRGVEKILGGKAEEKKETVVIQQSSGGPNVQALLKRGEMALADGKWDDAKGYYDRVLDMDAECGEAYLGLFLVEQKSRNVDEYTAKQIERLRSCRQEKLTACDQEEKRIQKAVQDNVLPGYLNEEKLVSLFTFNRTYTSQLHSRQEQLQEKKDFFKENRTLNRANQYATPQQLEKLKGMEDAVLGFLKDAIAEAQAEDEANIARITAEYAAHLEKAEDTANHMGREAKNRWEGDYVAACQAVDRASNASEYLELSKRFAAFNGYKESEEKKKHCEEAWQKLKEKEAKAARQKIKKLLAITGIVAVLAVALFMVVTKIVIPTKQYNAAMEHYTSGKYPEAAMLFYKAGDYEDSKEQYLETAQKAGMHRTISAGGWHTVGLKSDGTVVAVGYNDDGQCDVSDWTNIVAVSAGGSHTVGLKSDGTVVATKYTGYKSDYYGQCDVSDWTDIVAVSAGYLHTVGLKSDGTVVAVGYNGAGQCDVSDWMDIVAVSAGGWHTVGLKSDGTVVAVGYNDDGQCDVSDWTDIVAVSARNYHTVGLKSDGTVVAVGDNDFGQCNVNGWTDIVAVSAGAFHTVGLKSDGTVVATKYSGESMYNCGQCAVSSWTDIVAVSAGDRHTVGLKSDGTVVATKYNGYEASYHGQCDVSDWTDIKLPEI